jgi:hypothetical protein
MGPSIAKEGVHQPATSTSIYLFIYLSLYPPLPSFLPSGVVYFIFIHSPTHKKTTPKQNKTKQNKTKQNKTKQNKTKQNKTHQTPSNRQKKLCKEAQESREAHHHHIGPSVRKTQPNRGG